MGLLTAFLALTGAAGCATSGNKVSANETAAGYTTRGAVGNVQGTVPDIAERAERVLQRQGLTIATSMTGGTDYSHVLEGVHGDRTVRVTMTREGPAGTRVEVLAVKNPNEIDNGYARKLLQDIARG